MSHDIHHNNFLMASAICFGLLSGCASMTQDADGEQVEYSTETGNADVIAANPMNPAVAAGIGIDMPPSVKPKTSVIFKRAVPQEARASLAAVTMSGSMKLTQAISNAASGFNVIPVDTSADMDMVIPVRAKKMPLEDYLSYLSGMTGYKIWLDGSAIRVQGYETRTWSIPSGFLVQAQEAGLQALGVSMSAPAVATSTPYVSIDEGSSLMIAGGKPADIDKLDKSIRKLVDLSRSMVMVDMQMNSGGTVKEHGVSSAQLVLRNGSSASTGFGSAISVPGAIKYDGKLLYIEANFSVDVYATILDGNEIVVGMQPSLVDIVDSNGNKITDPDVIDECTKMTHSMRSEVIVKSGKTFDVAASSVGRFKTGIEIPVGETSKYKQLIFNAPSSQIKEVSFTVKARIVEGV